MTPDRGADQDSAGFAALLRSHRRAAGLTQAELASRTGVGVRTVRDLERGRSHRPHRTTVDLLAAGLGLVGGERATFVRAARGAPPDGGGTGSGGYRYTAPLPAAVELIGRDSDLAGLVAALTGGSGLITVVGLAGVGKSSLAFAAAHRVAAAFPSGVAGIVVSDVSTASNTRAAVAGVFGVSRPDELTARLAGGPSLLLIDSVERAPEAAAATVSWLAAHAPRLRVLAAGRRPVGLPGERVRPLAPLEVPPAEAGSGAAAAAEYPAVALFRARLRAVRGEPVRDAEIPALIELVRRVGGLPLALDLVAARGRVLEPSELLRRYGDRVLDLATPVGGDGARTLRDAVAFSYRRLEPDDQRALRRLSVLHNRWSVELAEELLTDAPDRGNGDGVPDPVPMLDRLIGLGLLQVRGRGALRFRLVDVVRDYALEQASAAGELAAARRRHAAIFARWATRVAPTLVGTDAAAGFRQLDEVANDVWAALAYATDHDPATALCLAISLPRWWRFRGQHDTGRRWLRRLLADPRTADVEPTVRAWAAVAMAQLALDAGTDPGEFTSLEWALAEFRRHADVTGELAARSAMCALWMTTGGYEEARGHGEAALALATRTGRLRDMTIAQNSLAWHDVRTGDLASAGRRLAAVDVLATRAGENRLRALARANLAEVARLAGRYGEAVSVGRRALSMLDEIGETGHVPRLLGTIGLALVAADRRDEAAAVLARLRTAGEPADGLCAAMEGALALSRGDRELAAEWYAAAADAFSRGHDPRDLAEALVGVVASSPAGAARDDARRRLAEVCREGGLTLLPRERATIGEDRGLGTDTERSPATWARTRRDGGESGQRVDRSGQHE